MLLHSRTGSPQKEPTDINAMIEEYVRLAYHGMRAKDKTFNVDFKTELDPDIPKIKVIPQDIGRVLLNLINNAFQPRLLPPTLNSLASVGGKKNSPTVIITTKDIHLL
jgi:nitrogen-specific signal transduction histidine kinase